ncbi:MAG: hypothetical protein D6720_07345 [Gammaproteobacteria bacterium]|nr:MAG: hypothetical protein D6720_07345 [Gammaproteobacteria bacterium]
MARMLPPAAVVNGRPHRHRTEHQMQTDRTAIATILLLLLGLILAGCAPVPTQPQRPDPDIARARALMQQQDYSAASQLYESLANRKPGMEGTRFLLQAIEAALRADDPDNAQRLIDLAVTRPLNERQQLHLTLLRAELALARNQADRAVDLLLATLQSEMPTDLRKRHLRDLATAYRRLGNLLESANALQQLDALLQDPEARLQVQTEILRALSALNERTLENLKPSPPGVAGGWMDLALLIKQYGSDPEQLLPRVQQWRDDHPGHPALPQLIERFLTQLQGQVERADHIAVLLPENGRFASAAAAIRDGLMISLYDLPEDQRPLLQFYDTSDPSTVWPIYNQAVAAGAQAVIGPLQKDGVRQLLHAGELAVPVLALNKVSGDVPSPDNLFMFSLDPEHEARLAAERIWQQGLRHPVVLVPENAQGGRLERAFLERWEALTGYRVDSEHYDPASADHSAPISRLLHVDRSKARHARLQHWLGRRIQFEPRRRADVDAVFMLATPRQAQSIKPQLAFFGAGDLATYATSQAWNGHLTAQQLADMRGIRLPDIPLIVNSDQREALGRDIPGVLGPGVRLYALGIDALRLQPRLRQLQQNPWESLDGQTGNLYMDAEGRIERQLIWIALDDPPRILGYSRRMDLTESGGFQQPSPEDTDAPGKRETAKPTTSQGAGPPVQAAQ